MQRSLAPLFVILLALLLGTLPGCASYAPEDAARRGDSQTGRNPFDPIDKGGLGKAYFNAACEGNTPQAQLLLERGADVNYFDANVFGESYDALQCASVNGHTEMVSLLLKHGARLDHKHTVGDYPGKTALELARLKGHFSIVQILEEAQAASTAKPGQQTAPFPSTRESPPPPIY